MELSGRKAIDMSNYYCLNVPYTNSYVESPILNVIALGGPK